jgi:gliding motility-associated-like protein
MKNIDLKHILIILLTFIVSYSFGQCSPDAGVDVIIDCNNPTAALNATGGVSYEWSPVDGLDDPSIDSPIASPTMTTTYTVVVTGANACVDSATVTVTVDKDEPIVNAGIDDTINCDISSVNLNGTGVGTYSWSPTTGLSDPSIANPVAIPTSTQTYTLTITGANGCSASDDIEVKVDKNLPNANAGTDDTITCVDLSVNLSASGGKTYLWSPAIGLDDPTIENPVASPTSNQTYTVTVTDKKGCVATDEVNVVIDITPPNANAGTDLINDCNTPTNILSPTGGVSYSWLPITGLSDPSIANPVANPVANQNYTVTVTGQNGCEATDEVIVVVDKDPPIANAGPDFGTTCAALSAQLSASGGVTYSWSPTTALSDPTISNPTAAPSSTTTYTVTVIGSNGCSATDNTTVTLNDITPVAIAGNDLELCSQYTTALAPDISNNLSTDYFTWGSKPSNPTVPTFSDVNDPNAMLGNLQEGVYTIFWTVSNNVCPPVQDTVLITIFDDPVANAGVDDSVCAVNNMNLNATLPAGTSTGEWSLQIDFPNPNPSAIVFTDSSVNSTNVSGLEEGVYRFIWTVSNGNCLDDKDTVEISVFNQPVSDAGLDNSLCAIYTDNLTAVAPAGTAQGFWYEDSNYGNPSTIVFSDSANPTSSISGLEEGAYQLIWETYNGNCPVDKDSVLINVYDQPMANAGADLSVCGVDSLNTDTLTFLDANHPVGTSTGYWSVDLSFANPSIAQFIDSTDTSSSVTNLLEGVSQFIWTVSNGTCLNATDVVQVTAYDSPFAKAGLDKELCGEYEVEMTALPPIGTSTGEWSVDANFNNPSIISFNNGSSPTSNSSGYIEGVYQLIWTVSNSNCASKNDTVNVTIYDEPIANAGPDIEVCDTSNVSFQAIDPVGTASGVWSEDVNFGNLTTIILLDDTLNNTQGSGYTEGAYQFIWTVSNGVCADDYDTVRVINYDQPIATAGLDQVLCELDTVQLNGGGNVGSANGRWEIDTAYSYESIPTFRDSSDSNSMADDFIVGNYPLIFVVENGVCPASYDTMLVINQEKPVAGWIFPSKACDNKCFDIISLSTPPSGQNLTLDWSIDNSNYIDSISEACLYSTGKFGIKLIVTATNGCQDSLIALDTITVNPAPYAGFDMVYHNDSLLELQRLDVLNSSSLDVVDFQYSLGNGDTLFDENLIYIYNEFGDYEITQWVENQYGCRDSISKGRRVGKRRSIYIPNAFTPNGDGINDVFGPVSRDISDDFYEFTISNRLGKTFFKSDDPQEKWDGTINGKLVQDATFIWSLTYIFEGEIEVMTKEGHVIVAK